MHILNWGPQLSLTFSDYFLQSVCDYLIYLFYNINVEIKFHSGIFNNHFSVQFKLARNFMITESITDLDYLFFVFLSRLRCYNHSGATAAAATTTAAVPTAEHKFPPTPAATGGVPSTTRLTSTTPLLFPILYNNTDIGVNYRNESKRPADADAPGVRDWP